MTGERTEQALGRIHAALARIEQATGRSTALAVEASRRHEQLRTAVTETLRDLDLLIREHGE
jgi:hypothetical protein